MKFILLLILVLTLLCTYISTTPNILHAYKDTMFSIELNDSEEKHKAEELSSEIHFEYRALEFLEADYFTYHKLKHLELKSQWNYLINPSESNLHDKLVMKTRNRRYFKDMVRKLFTLFHYNTFLNISLRRQFRLIKNLGETALSDNDYNYLIQLKRNMINHYNSITLCAYENVNYCEYKYDPHIKSAMINSNNPNKLQYYWTAWYNQTGIPLKFNYIQYIHIKNKVAEVNDFRSAADFWLAEYNEYHDFKQQLDNVFIDIQHLYQIIHGYVRWCLRSVYGQDIISYSEPIPMHLLGNLWSQSWADKAHLLLPYIDQLEINVTKEMIEQGYTPLKIFQMGDDFFQSLNMIKLPQNFWNNSIIEKPHNARGNFKCFPPSAWYLYDNDDVRIKQCTEISMNDFISTHRLLAQVQYYLQIQNLPYAFKKPPNSGFNYGFGESIVLSISSIKYLKKVGLLKEDYILDEQTRINLLFKMALDKIIFLPFAYSLDLYRHELFRNKIHPKKVNCKFWYLRQKYSGIVPPYFRNESYFDPPAEKFFPLDCPYMSYLFSNIIQFQLFKAACKKAGQYKEGNNNFPLDKCDFSDSFEAGKAFSTMLSMGASMPWNDVLKSMTGEKNLSAKPLLEYFKPLQNWLEKKIKTYKIHIGWTAPQKCDSVYDDWDFEHEQIIVKN